jgi:predicted O-methyltransferase YrrM
MSEIAQLVAMFVRATGAARVLEIGAGSGIISRSIAEQLPENGLLISLERNATAAAAVRQLLVDAGLSRHASVMVGDAKRHLHKIAGPFDLIVNDSDTTEYEALHDRLVHLLARHATLVTHNMKSAGRYNEVLARDARLATVSLNLGDGVAVSVKGSHT